MTQVGGRNINAIWAKLKADNLPNKKQQDTQEATKPKTEVPAGAGRVATATARAAAAAQPEVLSGFKDVDEAETVLKRTTNALTEGDQSRRRAAIRSLASSLVACEDVDLRTDVFVEVVAKHLLRRFVDKNEKCRELAIVTLIENIEVCKEDAVESLLPYCVPVLLERLNMTGGTETRGLVEIGAELLQASHVNRVDITDFSRIAKQRGSLVETSEEVRLLLVKLLRAIIKYGKHALKPYAQDCCEILLVLSHDTFYEVLIECSKCLKEFAEAMDKKLWMVSKILLAGYAPNLSHRRQAVRIAALEAISPLVFTGGHEALLDLCSFRDPNVVPVRAFFGDDLKINYMGKLITDSCVKVRQALVRVVGSWLLELPERKDHESRLLPYVLSGLIDDSEAVQAEALQILQSLGDLYVLDNAEDMKDKLYYLPDEAHAHGWMDGGVWKAIGDGHVPIPRPFEERPSLGVRLLVQQNFRGSLTALSKELSSWQEEPRLKAAKLLRIFLVCMEDYISSCLEKLLPALCQAYITEDKAIKKAVIDATQVLSWYADPSLSLSLLRARLSESFELKMRGSALSVLTSVVRGAEQVGTIGAHVDSLAKYVLDYDLAMTNDSILKKTAIEFCVAVSRACTRFGTEDALLDVVKALVLLSTDSLGNESSVGICSLAVESLRDLVGGMSGTLQRETLGRTIRAMCVEETFLENLLPELHVLSVCKIFLLIQDGVWSSSDCEACQGDLIHALTFFSCALESGPAFLPATMKQVVAVVSLLLQSVPDSVFDEAQRKAITEKIQQYASEHELDILPSKMAELLMS